jgi:phage-related protein
MYTVRWPKAVYVLHAFQKKSKSGRSTPKTEIDLVRSRLRDAEKHYKDTYEKEDRPQTRPGSGR